MKVTINYVRNTNKRTRSSQRGGMAASIVIRDPKRHMAVREGGRTYQKKYGRYVVRPLLLLLRYLATCCIVC